MSKLNGKRNHLAAKWFRDADLGGRSTGELRTATRLMDTHSPRKVSRLLRRMDDAEQRAFLDPDLSENARNDAYRLWEKNDNIQTQDVESSLRRVGSEANDLSKVKSFKSANSVNKEFGNWEDPYTPGTIVAEYESSGKTYVRAHGEDNKFGSFYAREASLRGPNGNLLSDMEIKNTLSLKSKPKYITEVKVPQGHRLRIGDIKSNFGGKQGNTQIEHIDENYIPEENFRNTKKLPVE